MTGNHENGKLDAMALGWGLVIGFLVGGIGALFNPPKAFRLNRSQVEEMELMVRNKLGSVVPSDPIAESIAEGKAAARRRRAQLRLER